MFQEFLLIDVMNYVFKCWLVNVKHALTEHLWLNFLFCDDVVNLLPKDLSS